MLMNIICQYGRTCRRYRFEVIAKNQLLMRVGSVSADYICHAAAIQEGDSMNEYDLESAVISGLLSGGATPDAYDVLATLPDEAFNSAYLRKV
ncbi:hypothetical protein PXH59_10250 [Xenorhabdus sp. SF857]|uniref:hypothetical protein n=1 Tax=Xenorhabdus bakwenae TaxID=3026967 RepID=UPI002557D6E4|nr:hypothetical protein [Xenorhabdus sp. SF857]WFQ81607.1 hypothetical protein PXH59_10250 [Xenorhabdus sp. SF857]